MSMAAADRPRRGPAAPRIPARLNAGRAAGAIAAVLLPFAAGALAAGTGAASAAPGGAEGADPRAIAVARRALEAMGGEEGFARLRTLRFDFVVERDGTEAARFRHVWDRHDGRYRVEGVSREGVRRIVLFDLDEPAAGRSWAEGTEETGEALEEALRRAHGRFINDTYWLLMPAKMLDPGVTLSWQGEETSAGCAPCDVVRLTFAEGVGLTPGDTYWAYVSRGSGLMERWEFVLQGREPQERGVFLWEDWRPVGGVRLSLEKRAPDGSVRIRFENVAGSDEADEAAFAPPPAADLR